MGKDGVLKGLIALLITSLCLFALSLFLILLS